MEKFEAHLLIKILTAWFDDGRFITGKVDQYGDARYVGLHKGRCSEVVSNVDTPDSLTFYEMDRGMSYLSAFYCEFHNGEGHSENLDLIGMFGNEHDFKFELARNYSECHTTVTMIK